MVPPLLPLLLQFGTAPVCQGECNTGDRVMARAATKDEVPADQGELCRHPC